MFDKLKNVANSVLGTAGAIASQAVSHIPETNMVTAGLNLANNLLGDIPEKDRENIHHVIQMMSTQVSAIRQEADYIRLEDNGSSRHCQRLTDSADKLQGGINALLLIIRSEQ